MVWLCLGRIGLQKYCPCMYANMYSASKATFIEGRAREAGVPPFEGGRSLHFREKNSKNVPIPKATINCGF